MSCPVCKEKLVISKDTAHGRKFLVCPKMDRDSFSTEEVEHYRKSLSRINSHSGVGSSFLANPTIKGFD